MSQAEPLVIQARPTPPSIVNYQGFQWDPSPSPEVIGYNLYYSSISSNVYDSVITNITTTNTIMQSMVPGWTYYMAATAVDTNGDESDLSPQYVFVMPTNMEFSLAFDQSVTNVSVQSSTDLMTWQASNARARTNGLWRVEVDPTVPARFFRGIGEVVPAL